MRAAIKNNGYKFQIGRIVINLAPADIKKEGSIYDLPIMIAILKASGQIEANTDDSIFIGEMSLDGSLRKINGIIAMAINARNNGISCFYLPADNAKEAAMVDGICAFGLLNVKEVLKKLSGEIDLKPYIKTAETKPAQTHAIDFC